MIEIRYSDEDDYDDDSDDEGGFYGNHRRFYRPQPRSSSSTSSSTTPHINPDLPAAPNLILVKSAPTTLHLSWNVPTSTSPILHYVLEQDRTFGDFPSGDYKQIYSGNELEFEAHSLRPGSTYHFLIKAVSALGAGPYCRYVSFRTANAPKGGAKTAKSGAKKSNKKQKPKKPPVTTKKVITMP